MKRHLFSGLFLLFSFGMGAYASQEKYVSFNDNWLFTLSDSHDYSLTTYNPEGWRQLDLPHDWTIENPCQDRPHCCKDRGPFHYDHGCHRYGDRIGGQS